MQKACIWTALLFVGTSALAGGVGPEIGYSTRGGRPEIRLINPDGSGSRLVYTGPSRTSIFGLSIKPGGGELSFEETPCCTSKGPFHLKTVSYGETGLGSLSRSVPSNCRISSIDYHPGDGSLIYVGCGGKIIRLAPGSTVGSDLGVPSAFKAAWAGPDHILYQNQDTLWKTAAATPTQSEAIVTTNCVARIAPSQSGAIALLSIASFCRGSAQIDLVNVSGKSQQTSIELGEGADLAPGDTNFIYMSPAQKGGRFLLVRNVSSPGTLFRVGAKADYSAVDWRN